MSGGGPGMERRIVSVVFADLVGFTSLSEELDAEDVAAVQDAYFAGVRDTVARYGGRLEKFIGDAAVAAFGAVRTREDDAERAVRCGMALTASVEALGGRLGMEAGSLRLRVGVNTGEAAVTTGGTEEGRLTGDVMNVAARFQAAADPGTVLCGEGTVLAAAHAVRFGQLVAFELKGKAGPVRGAVAISPRPKAPREAAMGSIRAPTVGRRSELTSLLDAAARAAGGTAELWTIVAPPGTGKSRMMDEIAARLEADRGAYLVLRVRMQADATTPAAIARQLVRDALGGSQGGAGSLLGPALPAERRDVLLAELRSLLAPAAPPSSGRGSADPQPPPSDRSRDTTTLVDERAQLFASWLDILDALAATRCQVWLVEDVHWASGDVLALVEAAGTTATPGGRMVIATARPSLLDSSPGRVDQPPGQRMDLSGLSDAAAVELLDALVGDALPAALAASVIERADGNPLFVEELIRTWVSVGVLLPTSGGWRLAVEPTEVALPATVQAVYAAQVDDLPPSARSVARHGSVAGRRFPDAAMASLDIAPDEAREGLETLARRSLIDGPHDVPPLGGAYAFRHALLRDAGYASLARAHRARLHVQLARWLESVADTSGGSLAESIGRHYAGALGALPALADGLPGDIDRIAIARSAARWLETAAEEALATAAYDGAASLLTASIGSTPAEDGLDRARRLGRLGEVLAPSAGTAAALERLDEAMRLFVLEIGAAPDDAARRGYARASAAAARLLIERLTFRDAARLASDAIRLIGDADPAVAPLLLVQAQAEAFESNAAGPAVEVAERVRAMAIATGDRALELDSLRLKQVALAEAGTVDETLAEELMSLAGELGRWPLVVSLRLARARELLPRSPDEAAVLLERAEADARARGLLESQAWIAQVRAEAAFRRGDWDAAVRYGQAALRIAEERGYDRAAVRTWVVLRPIAAFRKDAVLLEDMRRWFDAHADFPESPYGRLLQGAVDLDLHRSVEGGALVHPSRLRDAWTLPFDTPSVIAARDRIFEAWLAAGMTGEIREALGGASGDRPDDTAEPLERAVVLLWLARVAHAEGSPLGDVEARARAALAELRSASGTPWLAQALSLLEALDRASNDERRELRDIHLRLRGQAA